jgi:ABC-type methionine transport system permease subunit
MEAQMSIPSRPIVHFLMIVLGLTLIVAGTALGKEGAAIIGLIIAAVNYHYWQSAKAGLATPEAR